MHRLRPSIIIIGITSASPTRCHPHSSLQSQVIRTVYSIQLSIDTNINNQCVVACCVCLTAQVGLISPGAGHNGRARTDHSSLAVVLHVRSAAAAASEHAPSLLERRISSSLTQHLPFQRIQFLPTTFSPCTFTCLGI